ncbi:MAG: hypothetical protein KAT04_11590 [Methylococcales bacterium]|nr:hypothetical protein [Methylococcales bacterium]
MKSKNKSPIKVALYGMDGRTYKTMVMFLQRSCKGIAFVVDEFDAEIDIIDADFVDIHKVINERRSKTPNRPIIILSLHKQSITGVVYVKKPAEAVALLAALKEASSPQFLKQIKNITHSAVSDNGVKAKPVETKPVEVKQVTKPIVTEAPKNIDTEEQKKVAKHKTAMRLNEGSFSTYIGHVEGIDFSVREQALKASFNPKDYFMGYVLSAMAVAKNKSRILQLNSSWKPLVIFPHSHEIWLDADDKQLRAFAGLKIHSQSESGMKLIPVDQNTLGVKTKMENFYDKDVFLWKLAIWTSKGRYPNYIDINRPVFLKQWPNFTRLLITPHSLRISALLIEGPRTLINIADSLKIKPQYVFIFISAAAALDLVGQAERESDEIVAPPSIKKVKSSGLLGRVLGKLRS